MPAHRARAAPPSAAPIAPHQLWHHLSSSQQQDVRRVLIRVAQVLMAHLPNPGEPKETTHAPYSQPETSAPDPASS